MKFFGAMTVLVLLAGGAHAQPAPASPPPSPQAPSQAPHAATDYFSPADRAPGSSPCPVAFAPTPSPGSTPGPTVATLSSFEADWFESELTAAGEPSLYALSGDPARGPRKLVRFTMIPSFDATVVVSIDELPDGQLKLVAKEMSDGAAPETVAHSTDRLLTADEAKRVRDALARDDPASLAARDCRMGFDGSQWIFETVASGKYKFALGYSPEDGAIRRLGDVFLSLTPFR